MVDLSPKPPKRGEQDKDLLSTDLFHKDARREKDELAQNGKTTSVKPTPSD